MFCLVNVEFSLLYFQNSRLTRQIYINDFLNNPVEPKEDTAENENITTDDLTIDEEDEIDIIYDLDKGMYDV